MIENSPGVWSRFGDRSADRRGGNAMRAHEPAPGTTLERIEAEVVADGPAPAGPSIQPKPNLSPA